MGVRRHVAALAFGVAILLSGTAAQAHPHVWVKAVSEVIYAPDGSITGIRHAWTFDDMFSTYAVQGIESKTKGAFTREELGPLAQTNVESLKEFAFFTFLRAGGKKQKFADPVDYYLDYANSALTLHFTLPLKQPVKAPSIMFEVYDPTYFVDFALADKNPVTLVGAPSQCTFSIQRPTDGNAPPQQTLSEQSFLSGANANYGAMFANKVTVDCP